MTRRIVLNAFITLDGVVQGGGGPDKDNEGGFPFGGWAMDYDAEHGSEEDGDYVLDWESTTEALLLGRKTYDIWARSWGVWSEDEPGLQGEFTRRYNRIPKYIASRTLTDPAWKNSQVLGDDVAVEVARLKEEPGGEIRIWGSTQLAKTLAAANLIDEYRLAVYPIVLGTGKKLFSDGFPRTRLTLVESNALASGVEVNTYRPAV